MSYRDQESTGARWLPVFVFSGLGVGAGTSLFGRVLFDLLAGQGGMKPWLELYSLRVFGSSVENERTWMQSGL